LSDWLLIGIVFAAPLKFGLPSLPLQGEVPPAGALDWAIGSWPNDIFIMAAAVLLALHALRWIAAGEITLPASPINAPAALFVGALAVSTAFSIQKHISIYYLAYFAALLVVCFSALLAGEAKRRALAVAMLAGATAVAAYGACQYVTGFRDTRAWAELYASGHPSFERIRGKLMSGRVFSTFVYPNAFAGFLLTTIPLAALPYFARAASPERTRFCRSVMALGALLGALTLLLCEGARTTGGNILLSLSALAAAALFPLTQCAALILSRSQGGFAVLLAVGLIVLHRYDARLCRKAAVILLCVFAAAAGGCLLFSNSRFLDYFKLMSVKVRFEYLEATTRMIFSKLFIGYGPGTYGAVYAKYKLFAAEETQFAHNNYLQVWAEAGVAGFIGYCMIWFRGWKAGFGRWKESGEGTFGALIEKGAFLGLTAFLLHSLVDFDAYVPAIGIYAAVLLAVVVAPVSGVRRYAAKPVMRIAAASAVIAVCISVCALFGLRLSAGAEFGKGMELYGKKRYEAARACFDRATEIDPLNPAYHFQGGLASDEMGRPEEAVRYVNRAIGRSRSVPYFHYELAKCYFLLGGFEATAEAELSEAVRWYPNSIFYRNELAKYFEIVGQKEKALLEYREIVNRDPSNREAAKKIEELERG